MSSPRVQKLFEAMPDQLRKLGKYDVSFTEAMRWQGRVSVTTDGYDGFDAAVIDMTDAAWATLNKRFIIVAETAADKNRTQGMLTQSHAQGHYVDGSARFHVYMEAPATPGSGASAANLEYSRFVANVQQHLVGQLASPVQFHFTTTATEPEVDSVNGATSTAAHSDLDWLLPYGMTYPGGV